MKYNHPYIAALLLISSLTACDNIRIPGLSREDDCHKQAQERIELYNKPDTYLISAEERNNALEALFNECMREHDYQSHVDTRNVKNPDGTFAASPVAPVSDNTYLPPENVTVTTQTTTEQPFINTPSSKHELENILTQSN